MYNYSFIIPHKNCPDLLQRCVDSIPDRDDVQVIVVDDNSDEGKKPALETWGQLN
jgi:glycosyltransferase involved in cell wall biosynthesis